MDSELSGLLYEASPFQQYWLMSHAERAAVLHVLQVSSPECAIEIGTAHGGCLDQIRRFARRTYSIDIDPAIRSTLQPHMPNVEFLTGDSSAVLRDLLRRCEQTGEALGFVLIDGDHTYGGVQADIHALLTHKPTRPVWVLMHDSSNPGCRAGIKEAKWSENPFVHAVELDFVFGALSDDPTFKGQIWGGLALALLLPTPRKGTLAIATKPSATFDALYAASWHAPTLRNRLRHWLWVKKKGLDRRLVRMGLKARADHEAAG